MCKATHDGSTPDFTHVGWWVTAYDCQEDISSTRSFVFLCPACWLSPLYLVIRAYIGSLAMYSLLNININLLLGVLSYVLVMQDSISSSMDIVSWNVSPLFKPVGEFHSYLPRDGI
ncbi:hypothetical protein GGS26DRAFT_565822 [Hypomontagnella submonticulosa]|nr:hypothetical protein GGS26DRAFT_565822 [Hypomontagnella submonticulosa]